MTMPERLKRQLELWHAIVGLCVALAVPSVGFVISHRLTEERLAQAVVRVAALERRQDAQDQRTATLEKTQIQNQGEIKETLGRIDERLKALLERLAR